MAYRLVNKSKADCDINLFSGRVVRIGPLSYVTLDEKVTKASRDYYRQLRDLGIFLEEEAPVIEEKLVVGTENSTDTTAGDEVSHETLEGSEESTPLLNDDVTEKDLMRYNHSQLIEIASSYGLENLEALPKKEICVKILEAVSAGK